MYCEMVEGINVHKYGAHIFHTSDAGLLMRCLVHEAKRLLIYKECSVLDVAQALGFDGMNAFVSSFKSIEGVTPSEFLKRREEC